MSSHATRSLKSWLLPVLAITLVMAALAAWLMAGHREEAAPRDCALTPSAIHQGTFKHWRLSMSPGEGMSGEVSAAITLDDGREIVAYNVTNAAGIAPGDKVAVSEIQCIHRRVFLIQAGGG